MIVGVHVQTKTSHMRIIHSFGVVHTGSPVIIMLQKGKCFTTSLPNLPCFTAFMAVITNQTVFRSTCDSRNSL